MARYTEAVCRLCRRENQKLFLKGDKCFSGKCPQEKRSYAPGQHGQARTRKPSEYSLQLREKQKTKRFYGISESQMEKYFNMATKRKGITGENMLAILESRLDNVVYRMGLAMSRPEARQLVPPTRSRLLSRPIPPSPLRSGWTLILRTSALRLPLSPQERISTFPSKSTSSSSFTPSNNLSKMSDEFTVFVYVGSLSA